MKFDCTTRQVVFATITSVLILAGIARLGITDFAYVPSEITPMIRTETASVRNEIEPRVTERVNSTVVPAATMKTPTSTAPTPSRAPIRAGASTPTPIRVIVKTQNRAWIFYRGAPIYVRADAFAPLALSSFPRPTGDNGRGLDWFPTTRQSRAVVDRFVPELTAMKIRWVVVLQGMHDWDLITNDYLIERLHAAGIMTVMRIDRQVGPMDWPRLGWIVARYRERGVRYFQIYNEPNVDEEWGTGDPQTPDRFVSFWVQAAEIVAANGGYPGFSPMSAQDDDSDLAYFQASLEELERLGRYDLMNLMWVAVHNYGDIAGGDGKALDGFFRYRAYDAIAKQVLGGTLPIIATEGGLGDAEATAQQIGSMYDYIERRREPQLLAFAPWLIGNSVGGGSDTRWELAAWFTGTLAQVKARSIVDRVKTQ